MRTRSLADRVRGMGTGADDRAAVSRCFRDIADAVVAHRVDRGAIRRAARERLMDLHGADDGEAAYAAGVLTALIMLCDAQDAFHRRRTCETCGIGCRSVTTFVRNDVTVSRRLCERCKGRFVSEGWGAAVVSTD